MVAILRHQEQKIGESLAIRLKGHESSGPASLFLVDAAPGQSSSQHLRPYAESWVLRRSGAEFTVGDETARASSEDILVAPVATPHRWRNVGNGRLELDCIHPSDTIIRFLA